PPVSHMKYKKTWIGMDYGLTTSQSCILVFAEIQNPDEEQSRLKLITRIMMARVSTEDQVKVIKHLMGMYRPMALSFDSHGIGSAAFSWIQKEVREDPSLA